jgi:hypothetical protein
MPIQVRNVGSPADWEAIREICCETGNNGESIDAKRRPFFAELWVAPYEERCPRWTYVAEADPENAANSSPRIAGYLTGCADTRDFQRRQFLGFTVPRLIEILFGRYEWNHDLKRFLRQSFALEKTPNGSFPKVFLKQLLTEYPAHLHINLLKPYRSSGVGAKLMEQFFADLRDGGVSGVHVFCGDGPLKFYLKSGFEKLHSIDFRLRGRGGSPDRVFAVHCLGRKLSSAAGSEKL